MKGLLAFSLVLLAVVALTSGQRRSWSSRRRWSSSWSTRTRTRNGRGAPAYGGSEAYERCFRTGCAPIGLKDYCAAGVLEVAREPCISGRIDVTCCVLKGSNGGGSGGDGGNGGDNGGNKGGNGGPAYPVRPVPEPKVGHNPTKGYWDANGRCNWTGCAPKGLPAFCAAGQKESGTKECDDQGRIDVKCC